MPMVLKCISIDICIKIIEIDAHDTARFSDGVCVKTADRLYTYLISICADHFK